MTFVLAHLNKFSLLLSLAVLSTSSQHVCDVNSTTSTAEQEPSGAVAQDIEKYEGTLLLVLAFGFSSVLVAALYNVIRHHVFRDVSSLDSAFDAGGRVTTSLTAVTVCMQLLWPADILHSATITVKLGISGAFWYSAAVASVILLFPVLSVEFKTRAPGAKTYLQVIKARFGRETHIVFCCFALLVNAVILSAIIISGSDLFQALIKDTSPEFCVLVMAVLFGSYSFVGGLGSTFYVSYFNALVVFICLAVIVIRLFYLPVGPGLPFGDLEHIYDRLQCLEGPYGNEQRSFTTFWSAGSLVWAVEGVFVTAAVTFCDQASWQSRIAAKPAQGVGGFLAATLMWFAIPSTIGTSSGMAYLAFSAHNASLTLPNADIDAGLTMPFVVQRALGREGGFMVLSMFTMLMMSTGSGEVIAVSSIIVYDIFQSYLQPFRREHKVGHCILCGKLKGDAKEQTGGLHDAEERINTCHCPPVTECKQCALDQEILLSAQGLGKKMRQYKCDFHGRYRTYQDLMVKFKNWCIMAVTLGIVPFGLIMISTGIDLNWMIMTGCIITVPCLPGVILCILWVKATSKGMVAGCITGLSCGLGATLIKASFLPGGLSDFLPNTSDPMTVMVGAWVSFFVTVLVTVVVSLCTHTIQSEEDATREWQKVRDIDNPLNPWLEFYRQEFPDMRGGEKPSYRDLEKVFRPCKMAAIAGSTTGILLFIAVIPGAMATLHVLDAGRFRSWVTAMHTWCFLMAALVIVFTPLEEVVVIVREVRRRGAARRQAGAENSFQPPAGTGNHEVRVSDMTTTTL